MHDAQATRTVSAKSCRSAAKLFNYGNIITITVSGTPLLLSHLGDSKFMLIISGILAIIPIVLWFGASMLLYAMNRHHPNERVGHYTQQAAYRFYFLTGALVVVGTFFPPDVRYYLGFWVIAVGVLVPWSIMDIIRINKEPWQDTPILEDKA